MTPGTDEAAGRSFSWIFLPVAQLQGPIAAMGLLRRDGASGKLGGDPEYSLL